MKKFQNSYFYHIFLSYCYNERLFYNNISKKLQENEQTLQKELILCEKMFYHILEKVFLH